MLCYYSCPATARTAYGEVSVSIASEALKSTQGVTGAKAIVVTLEKIGSNKSVTEKLNVYALGIEYVSDPLKLLVGDYQLTSFLVLDEYDSVIYLAPKAGSELAHRVTNPLPVRVKVNKDASTWVYVEVIAASYGSANDFGYATFSFVVRDNILFCLELMSTETDTSDLVAYEMFTGQDTIFGYLHYGINHLQWPRNDYYKVYINKVGMEPIYFELFGDSNLYYNCLEGEDAYQVHLSGNLKNYIKTLQNGEDAFIYSLEPDRILGTHPDFMAAAWTNNSVEVIVRSFIRFEFSDIPSNAIIDSVKLSLFSYSSPANGSHSIGTESNSCVIQKVDTAWSEKTITWNNQPNSSIENQIVLLNSQNSIQDYLDIDITALAEKMIKNASLNFGFVLKMETEQIYRRMVFASSDNDDPKLHPKIDVYYSKFE